MVLLNLTVKTSFGCICGGKCECTVWSSGRTYHVQVENTETVQRIWDLIAEQNPLVVEKQVKPNLQYNRELLDLERRIISYDIIDQSELRATMPASACCSGPFHKAPKTSQPEATPV